MIDPDLKKWIDGATVEQLLYTWRFAPAGDWRFQGDNGTYYSKMMQAKREEDQGRFVGASKNIGWEP